MHSLVQITHDDDGELKSDYHVWHLVDPGNSQGNAALCTQEFFGSGESACKFKAKVIARGGITCADCLRIIKIYKAIRL